MRDIDVFWQAIRREGSDRILHAIPAQELYYRGCHHEGPDGIGHDCPAGTQWSDIWGVQWHKDLEGVMGFPRRHPLADLEALDDFAFPDPADAALFQQCHEQKAALGASEDVFLSGSHRDTLWERGYMLVGMEDLMVYMYTEPELVHRLFHRIMDFHLAVAAQYVKLGIRMACLSDDLGTQSSLLLGEALFDAFLLPEYARLFSFYRQHGVLIHFHSCGHILPLLDRLMDLGVDILNPVQASANDLDALRAKTRGRLLLHGGVDSAVVMQGTPAQVDALVARRIRQLGGGGEYICAPDQHMPYPPENLRALQRAVEKHGRLRA